MSMIDPTRPILVYLANGVQGGAVIRAALRRNLRVRAIVRDPSRAAEYAAAGVELACGDLDDPASLHAAHEGIHHAVLQVPIGPADVMVAQAGNALTAAKAKGLRSMILRLASASRPEPCAEQSFVANAAIEERVRASGLPHAIVRPTLYLDNLLKPSVRADLFDHGLFSLPIASSQSIAWTSAEDCAEAALMLLTRGAYGGDHRIAGPESVEGDALAERISRGLGRSILYRAEVIEAFEQAVDGAMGAGIGRRVGAKFRFFAAHPAEANAILAGAFEGGPGLEAFRPSSIETWVRRHRSALESPATLAFA